MWNHQDPTGHSYQGYGQPPEGPPPQAPFPVPLAASPVHYPGNPPPPTYPLAPPRTPTGTYPGAPQTNDNSVGYADPLSPSSEPGNYFSPNSATYQVTNTGSYYGQYPVTQSPSIAYLSPILASNSPATTYSPTNTGSYNAQYPVTQSTSTYIPSQNTTPASSASGLAYSERTNPQNSEDWSWVRPNDWVDGTTATIIGRGKYGLVWKVFSILFRIDIQVTNPHTREVLLHHWNV